MQTQYPGYQRFYTGSEKVSPDESCTASLETNSYCNKRLGYSGVRCPGNRGDALFGIVSIWKNYPVQVTKFCDNLEHNTQKHK